MGWPKQEACNWAGPNGRAYEPRYRPWYATGATGPKDVVIVVDVSGSMRIENRHAKAKEATKLILDTLSWKDFVTVVLFNHDIRGFYSSKMVPATDANKDAIKRWCDNQYWRAGNTNFVIALEMAFKIIGDSVFDGKTSMCQKAVLFLTDGVADFTSRNFHSVKQKAIQYDTYVFTYALGSSSEKSITKRLACENRGVFYSVSDEQDLADVMLRYFNYFVQGQEICNAAVTKYFTTTGFQVYGACLPMYNRTKPFRSLLGVACTDVNLVADVPAMQKTAGWNHFVCAASDTTKMCKSLDLTECHRQKIRLSYSQESVCTGAYRDITSETKCPCQDPNCQDDPKFMDENGYFCDAWIGDDCTNVDPKWGFTPEGLDAIRRNCPRSCGLCTWRDPCPFADAGDCTMLEIGDKCRACIGKTSGVDIEQRDMACPSDSPDNPIFDTTTDKPIFVGSAGEDVPALRGIVATSLSLAITLLAIARL